MFYHDKSFGGLSSDIQMRECVKVHFYPLEQKFIDCKAIWVRFIGNWVLVLVGSKSIFCEKSSFLHKNWKIDSFSFHSVWISCLQDSKSASKFCTPGRWLIESQVLALPAQAHISWASESHSKDMLVTNVLIYAIAVELSHSTLMWVNFSPSKTAFSSRKSLWSFFSNIEKSPQVDLDSTTAPQPLENASVLIHLSGLDITILL